MESAAQFLGDIATNSKVILKGTKDHVDGIIADLHAVGLKTTAEDAQSLATYLAQMKTGDGVDDRAMRQEKLMSWLFKLPLEPKSAVGSTLEHGVVQSLWDTLPNPCPGWTQHSGPQYRRADGSFNNLYEPRVGRAGEAYIRNVVSRRDQSKDLPSPEDVFEKLFRRRTPADGGFRKHPCGISANMFYMATLITHDLFNTDITNRFRNKTTSWNQEMQDSVRDKAGHCGKLHADVFADPRLDLKPPGVIAMALLWCRNHNWIAEQLLIESKDDPRFSAVPKNDDQQGLELLDEHLFQTARNINVGTFATVVLKDYVRMLLGINRENTTWTLPINQEFSPSTKNDIPKATGNQCSIEFNFIYRWHSAISVEDEQWIEGLFEDLEKRLGPNWMNNRLGSILPARIPAFVQERHDERASTDPRCRTYFALNPEVKRDPKTHKYPDAALADFIKRATESSAGAFGGRQVPNVFKDIEIMSIRHARELGVCTLNELRTLCNLRPYRTFSEMNDNEAIATALKDLYGDIADVELYRGLVAEQAKPRQEATGLCAGRTITYVILSDAVALVRGDRFLTTELNPYNLTKWGYDEIQPDNSWSFGNVLGDKLLNRHLGEENMPRDSIYTQYMFSTPEETTRNIKRFGMEKVYRETRL
ncbi:hypothetical protein EYB26_002074 [Talaromyces marneffei]|uniref:uncharacterized protein n=1 Tax=Talaromyces marneffei TaxID=37727 RepID=UPI0012A8F8EC|nr:uncharacterized protein EYB26_002074 [Talaromyces marneffei]QGA14421.1 hypothetical protein EYB26_002074 [Talaromyces marneffei]